MLPDLIQNVGVQHALLGAVGGLIGAIGKDNETLTLPCIERTPDCPSRVLLHLGFIGSVIIGAFAGYAIDHSPAVAGLAGYLGLKAVDYAVRKFIPDLVTKKEIDNGTSAEN